MTSLLRGVFNIRSGISIVFSLHRTIFRLFPPAPYQSACRGRAGWLTHRKYKYKYSRHTRGTNGLGDVKVKEQKLNWLAVWPLTYFPRVTHLSSIPVVFHQPLPSPTHLVLQPITYARTPLRARYCVWLVSHNTCMFHSFTHKFTVCIWGSLRISDFKTEPWFNTRIVLFHPTTSSENEILSETAYK